MRHGPRRVLCLALAGSWAASCQAPPEPATASLRVAMHSDPLSLDPYRHNEALTFALLRNVFEPLTSFDAHMQLGPSLAVSWENPDDSTWIFRLRPDVRFHNGARLTAEDVVWSLQRARMPETSSFGSYLVAVSNVRAIDDLTLEIKTARPYPILLNKLAFIAIVPRGSPVPIEKPVGTGPYRFVSFVPGERLTLEAFEGYWGPPPPLRHVEYRPRAVASERLRMLEAGEVDIVQDPGSENIARLHDSPSLRVASQEGLLVIYLLLRHDRPPLDDLRVRQAIDLAIDREKLVSDLWAGLASPAGQLVSRNAFGYAVELTPRDRDLGRARALLREAGLDGGFDLELEFREDRQPVAEALSRQLAEIGIRVKASGAPWGELFPRLRADGLRQAYVGGVLAASADASDVFDGMVHSRDAARGYGDNNHARYHNAELDGLIEQSGSTLDMLGRRRLLEQCSALLARDSVYLPLYAPFILHAAHRDVVWEPRLDGWILAAEVHRRAAPAAPATAR